jgi:hypothetical protein
MKPPIRQTAFDQKRRRDYFQQRGRKVDFGPFCVSIQ